jgi:hypothetical protein
MNRTAFHFAGLILAAYARTVYGAEAADRSPVYFEANRGQTDSRIRYLANGRSGRIALTVDGATFSPSPAGGDVPSEVSLRLQGSRESEPEALDPRPAKFNYLTGNDPSRWVTGVESFGRVRYSGVYPGIDLIYYGRERQIEYDFVVAPGADPGLVALRFEGATGAALAPDGGLDLNLGNTVLRQHKPVAYQEADGVRTEVPVSLAQLRPGVWGFRLGSYDHSRTLVIDPVLDATMGNVSFSGFFSGAPVKVVPASDGLFVLGNGISKKLPVGANAYQTKSTGNNGCYSQYIPSSGQHALVCVPGVSSTPFVAKFDVLGRLIWLTYFGGSANDAPVDIAVRYSGGVSQPVVVGHTYSYDFPSTPTGYRTKIGGVLAGGIVNVSDDFVMVFNDTGTSLLYGTFFGVGRVPNTHGASSIPPTGDYNSALAAVAVSPLDGTVWVAGAATGYEQSTYPVTPGAIQTTLNFQGANFPVQGVGQTAVVSRLDPAQAGASSLLGSTFLNGVSVAYASSIAVDYQGNAWVGGNATGNGFLVRHALQTYAGYAQQPPNTAFATGDGFVSVLDPTLTQLLFSTYIGGAAGDVVNAIAIGNGGAVVGGQTGGAGFPVTLDAAQKNYGGGMQDGFVSAIQADFFNNVYSLQYSTYLGGGDFDTVTAVSGAEGIAAAGFTLSPDFPTQNAIQSQYGGGQADGFISFLNGAAFQMSTFWGGKGDDRLLSMAPTGGGFLVSGATSSSKDLPQVNYAQTFCETCPASPLVGGIDGFISMVTLPQAHVCLATDQTQVANGKAFSANGYFTVARGGFRLNRTTNHFEQDLTLTYNGGLYENGSQVGAGGVLFFGSIANASLLNRDGQVNCSDLGGALNAIPYINLPLQKFAVGGSAAFTLIFDSDGKNAPLYSPVIAVSRNVY